MPLFVRARAGPRHAVAAGCPGPAGGGVAGGWVDLWVAAAERQACLDLHPRASRAQPDVPLQLRRERLLRLRRLLDEHGPVLAAAVQADFGIRSPRLTEMADFLLLRALLSHTLRHLARWMKPQKLRTPLYLQPASAWVQRQPLGVVGVIAPWNYPVQRALAPTITALAAGNRVLLKPSEHTPHLAAQLTALVAQLFAPDEWCVLPGDAALAAPFAPLPFDHPLFTRSTPPPPHHAGVGRQVALHHRRRLQSAGRSAEDCPWQAAQRRPDLHCARLPVAAPGARGRVCAGLPGGGGAPVPRRHRGQSRLRRHHHGAPPCTLAGPAAASAGPGGRCADRGAGAAAENQTQGPTGARRWRQPPDGAIAGVWRHSGDGADAGGDFRPHPASAPLRAPPRRPRPSPPPPTPPPLPPPRTAGGRGPPSTPGPAPAGVVLVRSKPGSARGGAARHRERGRDAERHAAAHGAPRLAVRWCGPQWLGRLPRRAGLCPPVPAKSGAAAIALVPGGLVLPAVWGPLRPGHGLAAPLAVAAWPGPGVCGDNAGLFISCFRSVVPCPASRFAPPRCAMTKPLPRSTPSTPKKSTNSWCPARS